MLLFSTIIVGLIAQKLVYLLILLELLFQRVSSGHINQIFIYPDLYQKKVLELKAAVVFSSE